MTTMIHTECKDCELSNGDCGHHFKMDGATNYDIASLSACDRYGNCEFFKPKAKPNTLISREALKKALNEIFDTMEVVTFDDIIATIDNAPTVELLEQITIKCDTEEEKQKLLSALINARLTICEEVNNETN